MFPLFHLRFSRTDQIINTLPAPALAQSSNNISYTATQPKQTTITIDCRGSRLFIDSLKCSLLVSVQSPLVACQPRPLTLCQCSPAVNHLTPHKALFTVRSHTTIVPFSSTITTSSADFHSDGLCLSSTPWCIKRDAFILLPGVHSSSTFLSKYHCNFISTQEKEKRPTRIFATAKYH